MEQSFLPHATIRTRIVVATVLMLIPLIVAAAVALLSLHSATRAVNDVADRITAEIEPMSELQTNLMKARVAIHDYLHDAAPADRRRFEQISEAVNDNFRNFMSAALPIMNRQPLTSVREHWQQMDELSKRLLSEAPRRMAPSAAEAIDNHVDAAIKILKDMSTQAREQIIKDEKSRAEDVMRQMLVINALVLAAGLFAALLVGYALNRSILRPLRALEEGTHRIGEGDLFHRVALDSKDELGDLARSFNAMAEKLERGQATLENLSVHDGLTGLFNYREFRRRLKEEADRSRRYGRPFSLLLLDLDHFKVINDTHGHQAGDEVLRSLANIIGQGVRPVDRVARYGGEEIALILPETPGGKALIVAERVRSLIANHPIPLSTGDAVSLTCSIGVAAFGEDGASDNEIIGAADSALYAAKHAGRNRVCRLEKT